MASVRCLDNAFGFTGHSSGYKDIPAQGNHLRNLIEGADMVMSHILHFYHLAALDYINTAYTDCPISGQAPWWPKDNTADMVGSTAGTTGLATTLILHYVQALNIRRKAHEMAAYIDGKHPCQPSFVPGGVTNVVTPTLVAGVSGLLGASNASLTASSVRSFIKNVYVPDVVTAAKAFSGKLLVGNAAQGVGKGCAKYLAYGTFPDSTGTMLISSGFLNATDASTANWTLSAFNPANIEEHITYSYYDSGLGSYDKLHPSVGVTKPSAGKAGAYSWLKAPRYRTAAGSAGCNVAEVGPLARVLVNTVRELVTTPGPFVTAVSAVYGLLGLTVNDGNIAALRSVLGRHAARAVECDVVADAMTGWLGALTTTAGTGETYRHRNIPTTAAGYGLTEAPRGALGHWIRIDGKRIGNYQCVVPTTWNCSPRDDYGQMGPVEQALNGCSLTNDATGRTMVGRIIRSFDPCIACAVHIVSPDKKEVSKFEIPVK